MGRGAWAHVRFVRGSEPAIPRRVGVYVIAVVQRSHGLLIERKVLYVGKSRNLRRRYREHVVQWLLTGKSHKLEFWWQQVGLDELDRMERVLIRDLQPQMNRARYKGVMLV